MALFCGLDYYSKNDIDKLVRDSRISGIVLGDMFCQRRMFDRGEIELYESINVVGKNGKIIIYQTPIYVTSRNRDLVIDVINYLDSTHPRSKVITQDIGVIKFIKENCSFIEVIWSRMGRTREYSFNQFFYKALQELDVSLFETESRCIANLALECGIRPLLVYGNIHYRTIGRRCYSKYELDIPAGDCSKHCRESRYEMETLDGTYKMTIDGFMLGYNLNYNMEVVKEYTSSNSSIVVYAKNAEDLMFRLSEIH